ncbi:MAG: anthranilate synthase component II, partial [Acidimicrobiales bacterium]
MGARVVVVDNYDSFVYNLVQYLGELGAEPVVRRNDEVDVKGIMGLSPDALLISPGPGRPGDAGVSNSAIAELGSRGIPVLGVCLGHQCIGEVYGGSIVQAPEIVHGKASFVDHDGEGVF